MRGSAPAAGSDTRPRAARVRWIVRIAGIAVLGALVWRSADLLPRTAAALDRTAWPWVAAAWLVYALGLLVSAGRMRVLLRAAGHRIGGPTLFGDLVEATALNALITVGSGELHRVARLGARGLAATEAAALVLLDRIVGLVVIAAAGAIGLFAFGAELTGASLPAGAIAVVAVAGAVAAHAAGRAVVARVAPSALPFFSRPRVLVVTLAFSVGVLLAWVVSVWLLARALGLTVGLPVVAFAAPLVALATLLPISIGGIGVREAGYALLLAPYGVGPAEAVALGLLQYAGYLVIAAAGGGLLLADRRPGGRGAACGVADELRVDT